MAKATQAFSVLGSSMGSACSKIDDPEEDLHLATEGIAFGDFMLSLLAWHRKSPSTRGTAKCFEFAAQLKVMKDRLRPGYTIPKDTYFKAPALIDLPALIDQLEGHHRSQATGTRAPISDRWNNQFVERIENFLALEQTAVNNKLPVWFQS